MTEIYYEWKGKVSKLKDLIVCIRTQPSQIIKLCLDRAMVKAISTLVYWINHPPIFPPHRF